MVRSDAARMGQDGFSADVPGVSRVGSAARAAESPAPFVPAARGAIEFADNGDGTLTCVRILNPAADDLDIQFEAGERPVSAIAARAFEGAQLRRVTLPPELRRIGEMAFSGCAHLSSVVIPAGVSRVGTLAFAKCASLSRVRVEPGVKALGPSCFSKCVSLLRADLPASVTSIGGGAFFGCRAGLTLHGAAGTYAENYARLNGIAFDSESWRRDETLVFSEEEDGSLTVLGPRGECPERVEIPSEACGRRIARVAPKAFFAQSALLQLRVGGGVREIGESAFFGCRSLLDARFERGLERVGDSAFAGCEALSQVTLPWGAQQIGRMAFFGCSHLGFVKLPPTTRVCDFAFDGCAAGLRVYGGVYVGRVRPDAAREDG